MEMSKFMRTIWSINGVIIFLFISIGGLIILGEIIDRWTRPVSTPQIEGLIVDNEDRLQDLESDDLQHVFYDKPNRIGNSEMLFSHVYIVDKANAKRKLNTSRYKFSGKEYGYYGHDNPIINVMFYTHDERNLHVLLKKNGFIFSMDYPTNNRNKQSDEVKQNYILYGIAQDDTNNDLRINENDDTAYYISDLQGQNLKRITPKGLELEHLSRLDVVNERIFFKEYDAAEEKDEYGNRLKSNFFYVYDMKSDRFRKLEKLQSMFESLLESSKSDESE